MDFASFSINSSMLSIQISTNESLFQNKVENALSACITDTDCITGKNCNAGVCTSTTNDETRKNLIKMISDLRSMLNSLESFISNIEESQTILNKHLIKE